MEWNLEKEGKPGQFDSFPPAGWAGTKEEAKARSATEIRRSRWAIPERDYRVIEGKLSEWKGLKMDLAKLARVKNIIK